MFFLLLKNEYIQGCFDNTSVMGLYSTRELAEKAKTKKKELDKLNPCHRYRGVEITYYIEQQEVKE